MKINYRAVTVVWYGTGILKWTEDERKELEYKKAPNNAQNLSST